MEEYPNPVEFSQKFLKCPLTGKIFNVPIIDCEGTIYEEQAFIHKFNNNDKYHKFISLKNFIADFLETYPEFKNDQYHLNDINKFSHIQNKKCIDLIFEKGKYDNLKYYNKFNLNFIKSTHLCSFLTHADSEIIKCFLDNVDDLCVMIDDWYLVNYVCKICCNRDIEIVKHLLSKGNQMKLCCNNDNWSPLHQITFFSTSNDLLKYAIDQHINEGLNLLMMNNDGNMILENIFNLDEKIINFALEKIDTINSEFQNVISKLLVILDNNSKVTFEDKEKITQRLLNQVTFGTKN